MTAWDKDVLLRELKFHHVDPQHIDYLVCTHGEKKINFLIIFHENFPQVTQIIAVI